MQDDFLAGIDTEDLDDALRPPSQRPLFPRVLIADGEDTTARGDALALATTLAAGAEPVPTPEGADLVVIGSGPDAAPGRLALTPPERALLEAARCPVAVAPRGHAARDDHELRRIDVGIDGGRGASAALAVAVRLARAHLTELRLVAVAEVGPGPAGEADAAEIERLARHLAHAGDEQAGIRIWTELREGPADQIIVGLARDADLLVLGSRAGYGNPGRVALGATGERILAVATRPTLVVPAP